MATIPVPAHVAGADEDMQRTLELWGLLHSLLRHAWLIALVGAGCGIGAWLYVRHLPNQYRSTAVIEIQSRDAKALNGNNDDDDLKNPEAIETIIQNFHNRSLMERTARALNLANDPAFLGGAPTQAVSSETLTNMLLGGSTASRRPNTRLVDVSFVHSNPFVARKVTDALVTQFIAQGQEDQRKKLEDQQSDLQAKYNDAESKLSNSEIALQKYKEDLKKTKSLDAVSLEDRRNYVEDKLRELNTNLTTATGERRGLQSDTELVVRAGQDPKKLLGIASIAQDPQVSAAQQQLNKAEADFSAVSERYGAKHPVYIAQVAQTENVRHTLEQAVRSAPDRLQSRYQAAIEREDGLQTAVSDQQKTLLELESNAIPYRKLTRDAESNRALAQAVLTRLKESTLALGKEQDGSEDRASNLQVVEPAVEAVSMANRRRLIVIGAFIAGSLLIASIIAAMHLMNTSVRTVDAAERLIGVPVFAAVPTMPKEQSDGQKLALLSAPNTPAAEAFRTLRCALSLLGPKGQNRVFLFTSAVPGEGKSLTAANTAIAFAQQGLKTLLVEADLRRPSLATKLFSLEGKLPGIGDYMTGKPAPVSATPVPNLSLMTAGSHTHNPAELLSSALFDELITWMRTNYERIVIDTAPVNVVSDTLNIVGCASVICLVVRSESTSRKVILRAVELLRRSGVKPDGMVLNCMPLWKGIDNHYDYSGKGMYGSEETYGDAYAAQLAGAGSGPADASKP